jgi:hypothetical protein
MSRYVAKTIYPDLLKRPTIWNGGSINKCHIDISLRMSNPFLANRPTSPEFHWLDLEVRGSPPGLVFLTSVPASMKQ